MSIKTLFMTGGVLALLGLATPPLPVRAATATVTEPLSSPHASAGELLTLRSALDRALQVSPELSAYDEESRARAAEISQAARWTNPELSIEVENVAGSGPYRGFDAAETTWQLSQEFALGSKRQLRRSVAEVEHDRARHDLASARIEVQARIARHFLTTLAAQEHLKLAEEQIALATRTLTAVEEKIVAGKAPAVEKYRFQSALAEARLDKEKARLSLATARQTLAGHLGLETPALGGVSGDLTILPPLPAYSEIEAQLDRNPESVRRQLESEARRRALAVERANRLGDPTIAVGLRNFKESDDSALLFGLSLPLPLFDRNQGNVQAASSRLAAAQAQEANGRLESRAGLAESWQSLAASLAEAQALRAEILPSAQQTYEAASFGYQSGKFAVLEVQEAQQTLIEVRERYLEVLTAAQLAAVELDRLLGRAPLATVQW
jgi:cobalt-zinc-cadmium efflux system outer membrane protein